MIKKSIKYLALCATALTLFSCSDDDTNGGIQKSNSFTATQEQLIEENDQTFAPIRTVLSDNNVNWQTGDKINLYDGNRNGKYSVTTANGTSCTFTTTGASVSTEATSYIASYPYDIKATFSGNTISNITLPSNQMAVDNSFDPACNLMVARSSSSNATLIFRHLCSYIKLTPTFDCARIVLEFNGDNAAGTFDVTVANDGTPTVSNITDASSTITLQGDIKANTTYYVAVLPGSYTKGFKVTLEEKVTRDNVDWDKNIITTGSYTREATSTLTMNRAKIKNFGTFKTDDKYTTKETHEVEFVDLGYGDDKDEPTGTKVLWAKCNLGATKETENGDYYAWGEVKTRDNEYTYENYLCKDYYPKNLDLAHDAAAVNFGKGWKTPSDVEFATLKEQTIWVYYTEGKSADGSYNKTTGYYVYPAGATTNDEGKVVTVKDVQVYPDGKLYHTNTGYQTGKTEVTDQNIIKYVKGLNPETNKTHLFIKFAGLKEGKATAARQNDKGAYWTNGRGNEPLYSGVENNHNLTAYYLGMDNGGSFNMKSQFNTRFHGLTIRPCIKITW